MMEMMETLIIKRSEWLRGEGSKNSYLCRNDDGKKCCLGIYLNSVHQIPVFRLSGLKAPRDMPGLRFLKAPRDMPGLRFEKSLPDWLFIGANDLMMANDLDLENLTAWNTEEKMLGITSESTRETVIAKMFKANGVKVIFTN
jgi:hypothetical protein